MKNNHVQQGKVVKVLPTEQYGEGKSKKSFVLEYAEAFGEREYKRLMCFDAYGKAFEYAEKLEIGDVVTVSFSVSSREYKGKYYTNVIANRINVDRRDTEDWDVDSGEPPY